MFKTLILSATVLVVVLAAPLAFGARHASADHGGVHINIPWKNPAANINRCAIRLPNCPPAGPSDLQVLDTTTTSVVLGWMDNATNEEAFVVNRRRPAVYPSSVQVIVPAHSGTGWMTYTVTGLSPATTYCFWVKAWNANGSRRMRGSDVCATTDTPPPPAAPSGLSITDATQTSISLRWTDNATNEDGFQIQRRSLGGSWSTVATLGSHSGTGLMSWTNTGLSPATTRCYRVKAFHAWGSSSYSAEKCGQTDEPPPPPPDLLFSTSSMFPNFFPRPGQAFTAYFEFCNIGGSPTGSFDIVIVLDDGLDTWTISAPSYAPGACDIASVPYPSGLWEGSHYFDFYLDYYNEVTEGSESNNYGYLGFAVS